MHDILDHIHFDRRGLLALKGPSRPSVGSRRPPDAPDDAQAAAGGGGGEGGPGMGTSRAPPASDVAAAAAYLRAAEAVIEEDARRSQLFTQPLAPECTAQGRRQRAERARVRPSRYDD